MSFFMNFINKLKEQTLATGVVQLLAAEQGSSYNNWNKKHVGIVCLVKDYSAHDYFLRLYDIANGFLLWEQVIFDEFYSVRLCDELVAFEGDNNVFGLNFANVDEATDFKRALDLRVQALERKWMKKNAHHRPAGVPTTSSVQNANSTAATAYTSVTSMGVVMPSNTGLTIRRKTKSKKEKKKITKEEIGEPTNFEHLIHVGYDPLTGFAGHSVKEELEPDIRAILEMTHLPTDLKEDKAAVYSVINQFGGVQAVKRNLELDQMHRNRQATPPSLPPRNNNNNNQAPNVADDRIPPKPVRKPIRGPIGPSISHQEVNHASQSHSFPAPPPPLLVQGKVESRSAAVMPPPPPPPPPPLEEMPATRGGDSRANLLAEIRRGKSLKPVSELAKDEPTPRREAPPASVNGKHDLMNQISQGVHLKPVGERESAKEEANYSFEMQGIAGLLAQALMERRNKMVDTESSDDEDDDEEWED